MGFIKIKLKVLNYTTNAGQPLAAKGSLGGPLWSRRPPNDHLVALGFPGFAVEIND